MSEKDFDIVCSKIDEQQEFLNLVSQEIWRNPELAYEEHKAHEVLVGAIKKLGFDSVQPHYLLPTAFRAEYASKKAGGPTLAVLLEYDALPEIGHACGHNLISEAGLAASMAIKAAMEADPDIKGKLVVLGTPAEELGGGKLKLLELGAFKNIDAAMMVHPFSINASMPPTLSRINCTVDFQGKEAHAAAFPWLGVNALDAAVSLYQNIALLRQQTKPACRIHAIITKGGSATNVIPAESRVKIQVRATSRSEMQDLRARVKSCIDAAALSTGCQVRADFDDANIYENMICNKTMAGLYEKYTSTLGMQSNDIKQLKDIPTGSTDMGNVSHVVPSIHPVYGIGSSYVNHTKGFTSSAGDQKAQGPTLIAAKAIAGTALELMRDPTLMESVKLNFEKDLLEDINC